MFSKFKKNNDKQQLVVPNNNPSEDNSLLDIRKYNDNIVKQNTKVSDDDINTITQVIFNPIIERLLAHPVFIMSIVSQLHKNQDFINQIVKFCIESFESKYDITPTQIYKDKIQDSENMLNELNNNIAKRSEEFTSFKEQIIEFQNSSVEAYVKTMEDATKQLLEKIKL